MKYLFFSLLVFGITLSANSQSTYFSKFKESEIIQTGLERKIIPTNYVVSKVDITLLRDFLWSLPHEKDVINTRNNAPILELPLPDGSVGHFRVWESSIQEPALEAKFPEIRTFAGQGIDDPYATIRFDLTPFGFHAQILSVNGNIYIDPYARGTNQYCISYYTKDNIRQSGFFCGVKENPLNRNNNILAAGPCRGTQLYSYRLAVACTGEYAVAVGGTSASLLHAAIVTSVNRVDGVYETEISVRLILVANNNLIEFLSASSDPFNGNNNANTLITESQTQITNRIGSANFDIGHTFSTGGGGLAQLGAVCKNTQKASGITGSPNPVGDDYDIDYVAHEMGHQFGGNHTFNSTTSNCGGGNRNASTAYEVGSGTTIMAYAGICGNDDIQMHSDPFFHSISFDEISNYLQGGGSSCKVSTATGNTLPVITDMSNNNANIPLKTPFTLNSTATDSDGDALTYCWEEWDLGTGGAWNNGSTSTTAPLFKSRIPKTTGTRTFPDIARIIANYLPAVPPNTTMGNMKGETLPTVARSMKFRLTVRDNRSGGGGVVTGGSGCLTGFTGTFQVNAITGTGPFQVTSPNGGESWPAQSSKTVIWNVAGTNAAPINTSSVKITLSTDGGYTYPIVILDNTPNDGTEIITVPNNVTTTARVRVEAVNNIYFDISNANFTITGALASGFNFNNVAATNIACGTQNATATITSVSQGGFSSPISLTATGNPSNTTVSISSNPLIPGNSTTVTLNNTNSLTPGTYNIIVTGSATGASDQTANLSFIIAPGVNPIITTQPSNIVTCTGSNVTFICASSTPDITYQWMVSTDGGNTFSNIPGSNSSTYTITDASNSLNNNRYKVIVMTACGMSTSNIATLTVNELQVHLYATPDQTALLPGNTVLLKVTIVPNASYNLVWRRNGVIIPNSNIDSLIVHVDQIGTYTVEAIDPNGFCNSLSNEINVRDSVSGRIFIFPNPASNEGNFTVSYYNNVAPNKINKQTVLIYENHGAKVFEKTFDVLGGYSRLNISAPNLSAGAYIVVLRDGYGNKLGAGTLYIRH